MIFIQPGYRNIQSLVIILFVIFSSMQRLYAHSEERELDNSFKAALVYKITTFVRWPQNTVQTPRNFHICLLDDGLTTDAFSKLENKQIFKRPILVSSFRRSDMVNLNCSVLYISPSKIAFMDDIIGNLKNRPLLTIGESKRFSERGGMIAMEINQGKIKFFINKAQLDKAGLKASASLLQLSTIVNE